VFGSLGDPQSQNRYVYCRNNPQKLIDPTGHWWETAIDLGMLCYDANEFRENPNWMTGGALLVDIAFLLAPLPNVLGLIDNVDEIGDGIKLAGEVAEHADDIADGSYTIGGLVDEFVQYSENISPKPSASPNHFGHSDELADVLGYGGTTMEKYGMWENGAEAFFKDGIANLDSGSGYELFYDMQRGGLNMVYNKGWMVPFRDGSFRTMYDISQSYNRYINSRYRLIAGAIP